MPFFGKNYFLFFWLFCRAFLLGLQGENSDDLLPVHKMSLRNRVQIGLLLMDYWCVKVVVGLFGFFPNVIKGGEFNISWIRLKIKSFKNRKSESIGIKANTWRPFSIHSSENCWIFSGRFGTYTKQLKNSRFGRVKLFILEGNL